MNFLLLFRLNQVCLENVLLSIVWNRLGRLSSSTYCSSNHFFLPWLAFEDDAIPSDIDDWIMVFFDFETLPDPKLDCLRGWEDWVGGGGISTSVSTSICLRRVKKKLGRNSWGEGCNHHCLNQHLLHLSLFILCFYLVMAIGLYRPPCPAHRGTRSMRVLAVHARVGCCP